MPEKKVLDVRGLSCPEPADQVLAAISELAPGQYLEVLHYREPKMFFPMLVKRGFEFSVCKDNSSVESDCCVRVMIWRRQDVLARDAAQSEL